MKKVVKICCVICFMLFISCSQQSEKMSDNYQSAPVAQHSKNDNTPPNNPPVSSSAAKSTNDGNKKFIRTADLKFKVDNVSNSTYAIESIVSRFSGYVTYTKLESEIDYTTNIQIAPDTIEELIHYSMHNDITIRVPNYNLDTTLKALIPYINFLDHRIVSANDVSLQILASELEEDRKTEYGERLQAAIDNNEGKIKEIGRAERKLDEAHREEDQAYLRQLQLDHDVKYSTINLHIYQNTAVRKELHTQSKTTPYTPNLSSQFVDNIAYGWNFIVYVFLFLIKYWSLFLCGIGLYFLFVYIKNYINN